MHGPKCHPTNTSAFVDPPPVISLSRSPEFVCGESLSRLRHDHTSFPLVAHTQPVCCFVCEISIRKRRFNPSAGLASPISSCGITCLKAMELNMGERISCWPLPGPKIFRPAPLSDESPHLRSGPNSGLNVSGSYPPQKADFGQPDYTRKETFPTRAEIAAFSPFSDFAI